MIMFSSMGNNLLKIIIVKISYFNDFNIIKANIIGWLMTSFELLGIIGWVVYSLVDALVLNPRSLKTLIKPQADWGPLLVEHKRLAVHLDNLEPYHDSKRIKKVNLIFEILIFFKYQIV